ncbi:hypothetical protein ACGVWS_15235 [Enterobacteriaceae bacterium LUAb1]
MARYGAELRPVTSESAYKRLGKGTLIQWQIAGQNKALTLLMTDDQQTLISDINSRTGHLPEDTLRKITPRIIWQSGKAWLAAVSPQEEGFTALPLRIQAAEPGEKSFGELVIHADETLDPAREVAALTLTHEIRPEPVPAEVGYQYAGIYYRQKLSDDAIEYFIKKGEDFYPVKLSNKYDSWMLSKGENSQEEGVYITFSDQEEWQVNRVTKDDLISPEILARRATSGARMASLSAAADQNYDRLLARNEADVESGKIQILNLLRPVGYVALDRLRELIPLVSLTDDDLITFTETEMIALAKRDNYNDLYLPVVYAGLQPDDFPFFMRATLAKIKDAIFEAKHMAKLAVRALDSNNAEDILRINNYLQQTYHTEDPELIQWIREDIRKKTDFNYHTLKSIRNNNYRQIRITSVLGNSPAGLDNLVIDRHFLAGVYPNDQGKNILIPIENNMGANLFMLEDTINHEISHWLGTEDPFYLSSLPSGLMENAQSAYVSVMLKLINGFRSESEERIFINIIKRAYSRQGKIMSHDPLAENLTVEQRKLYLKLLVQQVLNDPVIMASLLNTSADFVAMATRDIAYKRPYDDPVRKRLTRRDTNAVLAANVTNTTDGEREALQMTKLSLAFYQP